MERTSRPNSWDRQWEEASAAYVQARVGEEWEQVTAAEHARYNQRRAAKKKRGRHLEKLRSTAATTRLRIIEEGDDFKVALVDTGACTSCIGASEIPRARTVCQIDAATARRLQTANGEPLGATEGTITLHVQFEGHDRVYELEAQVVQAPVPFLLGMNFLKKYDAVINVSTNQMMLGGEPAAHLETGEPDDGGHVASMIDLKKAEMTEAEWGEIASLVAADSDYDESDEEEDIATTSAPDTAPRRGQWATATATIVLPPATEPGPAMAVHADLKLDGNWSEWETVHLEPARWADDASDDKAEAEANHRIAAETWTHWSTGNKWNPHPDTEARFKQHPVISSSVAKPAWEDSVGGMVAAVMVQNTSSETVVIRRGQRVAWVSDSPTNLTKGPNLVEDPPISILEEAGPRATS